MIDIKAKYDSKGKFKPIIQILVIIGSFTLMDANCKKEIEKFMIKIFKLVKANDTWMYNPMGEFT